MVLELVCENGHKARLSKFEMADRLNDNDFTCQFDGCGKGARAVLTEEFWNVYVRGRDRRPHIRLR